MHQHSGGNYYYRRRRLQKHPKGTSILQLNRIKKTLFIFHLQSLIIRKRGCCHRTLPPPPYLKEAEKGFSKVVTVITNCRRKKRRCLRRSLSLNNTPRTSSIASANAGSERIGDDESLEYGIFRALEGGVSIKKSWSFNGSGRSRMSGSDSDSKTTEEALLESELLSKDDTPAHVLRAEMEQMKEKFSKLLLGEDMSGGGKGVSSALALSNAITNLAASVFGEVSKLEPMPEEKKARWRTEIEWLLSVTDHIVEFVPAQQKSKDGINMEVMMTRQRKDIMVHVPALRRLDILLIDSLDNFGSEREFWYVSGKDATNDSEKAAAQRTDDKWWIPTPKIPIGGLSEKPRKVLYAQKDDINQILKVAMSTNAHILSEMEIPESYIETLPKNGKSSLGESIYKSLAGDTFDPEQFLSSMKFSTEHKVLDLKNRLEASAVIWKRKMNQQKDAKSSRMSLEKREQFEERAESLLLIIKRRFPGLPQSSLEISKIQYNKDIGQAVLESYSRIIESLASKLMSRIDDVLYADLKAQESGMLDNKITPRALEQESEEQSSGAEASSTADEEAMNSPEQANSMESAPDTEIEPDLQEVGN